MKTNHTPIDSIEVQLILDAIRLKHGYDFGGYAEASLQRRVEAVLGHFSISDPLEAIRKILHEPNFFPKLLSQFTVTTSEMFRDPEFYKSLRETLIPLLRTYPTIKVWSAGCSTGEEIYSLSILFEEEGLADRTVIYATDINPRALKAAQAGIYEAEEIQTSTKNYQDAGGRESFNRYYTADYGLVKMNSDLLRNVVFSEHNLATDHVFAECQLILCRNVLIYFNKPLQERVFELFTQSLRHGGFLCLGSKESLKFSSVAQRFEAVDEKWKIFRKTGRDAKRELKRDHNV